MAATQCIWAYRQDSLLKFKLSVRMRKKRDLSNFEHSMVVGAVQAGLRSGIFPSNHLQGLQRLAAWYQRSEEKDYTALSWLEGSRNSNNQWLFEQKRISECTLCRWATGVQGHTAFHSCQIKTGTWGLTNIEQWKIEKTLSGIITFRH